MGFRWTLFVLVIGVAGGTPAWVFVFTGASPAWAMWPLIGLGVLDLALWAAILVRDRLRERGEG